MPDPTLQDHERARACADNLCYCTVCGNSGCPCDKIVIEIEYALAEQRERDAKVAENWKPQRNPDGTMSMARHQIAAALRKGDSDG
jgi:hypothetical protein